VDTEILDLLDNCNYRSISEISFVQTCVFSTLYSPFSGGMYKDVSKYHYQRGYLQNGKKHYKIYLVLIWLYSLFENSQNVSHIYKKLLSSNRISTCSNIFSMVSSEVLVFNLSEKSHHVTCSLSEISFVQTCVFSTLYSPFSGGMYKDVSKYHYQRGYLQNGKKHYKIIVIHWSKILCSF
jgi:hypothetical protein